MIGRIATVASTVAAMAVLAGCGGADAAPPTTTTTAEPARTAATAAAPAPPRDVATGLDEPWGLAFLPDGDALVSERLSGRILRIPAGGGPAEVAMTVPGVRGNPGAEGGLLGLAVSPRYDQDGLVYAYVTTAEDNRVVRFRLDGTVEPILTGLRSSFMHNGGRLAFGPDGMLYVTVGDVGQAATAQDRTSLNGKILRITPDGAIPRDNPFPGSPVWSLGHRNPQGLAWDARGRLWAIEFGQDRFDELNLIRKGGNYGWPTVEGRAGGSGGRFIDPKVTWRPDEASPSGAALAGSVLYIGALRGERLLRVRLNGTSARKLAPLLRGDLGRLRTVTQAPDGSLWITTSNGDGRGTVRDGDDRIVAVAP